MDIEKVIKYNPFKSMKSNSTPSLKPRDWRKKRKARLKIQKESRRINN